MDSLCSYLYDDLNNLASGWGIKRSCESHNLVTFVVWYVYNSEDCSDLLELEKHNVHKILEMLRYPKDRYEENEYLIWHNYSRSVTDNAEKYQGESTRKFIEALFKCLCHGYENDFC